MTRTFGTRAAAAVTAGLMALTVSAAPVFADIYNPSVGDQTGTGQTDLTMVLKNGTDVFGGTEDFTNPDEDRDGLGDNIAFTVPSAINYVVRANGQLIGPSEGVAHIDNESVFPVEVDSVLFTPGRDFNIVEDARSSNRVNAVDLQVGPAQDMLQMSNYKVKHVVGDPTQWRMSAKGTGDGSQVPLKSTGDVANLDVDVTSRTTFGKIHWYVSPAYSLPHGVTVNYEFTSYDGETFSGQKTLYKLHGNESPVTDILPEVADYRSSARTTVDFDGQTYSGYRWSDMFLDTSSSSGPGSLLLLNLDDLDGKTVTVRGSFLSRPEPITYEHGLTVNYQITDTRTNEVIQGKTVFYDIYANQSVQSSFLPDDVRVSTDDPFNRLQVVLTYDGRDYVNYVEDAWNRLMFIPESGDEGADEALLDMSELDGKTVDVSITFKSEAPPVMYTQGVTLQYELLDRTSNETLTGQTTLYGIDPGVHPIMSALGPDPMRLLRDDVSVEYEGNTYSGNAWGNMLRDGQSLPLDELDGKTIVLRGSFSTSTWS